MDAHTLTLLDDALARARALLEPLGFLFGAPRLLDEGSWGRYDVSIDPPDGRASKLQVHVNGKGKTSVVPQGPAALAMKAVLEGRTDSAPRAITAGTPAHARVLPLTRAVSANANAGASTVRAGAASADAVCSPPTTCATRVTAALPRGVSGDAIVVDCSKFGAHLIGPTEWRGMVRDGADAWTQIFRSGQYTRGHNNLGEFLAIVDALQRVESGTLQVGALYSDSRTAISWVTKGVVKTTIDVDGACDALFAQRVHDARAWLATPACARLRGMVRLWDTPRMGENPADFGRK